MIPEQLQISNLRPGEQVKYVLHRHWITLVYSGIYVFIMILFIWFGLMIQTQVSTIFSWSMFSLMLIGFTMIFSLFIFVYWVDNELDFYVVTNERIIGIEQLSFLNRTVRECSLDQVQEINGFASGLLENLIGYGCVTIRTASDTSEFKMGIAPNPLENARLILNIVQEYKGTHRERIGMEPVYIPQNISP